MKMNSTLLTLNMILTVSTLMSMSSNNWMFMWIMIEINTFTFMPLMTTNKMIDQPMKYFIIQSTSSFTILLAVMYSSTNQKTMLEQKILMLGFSMKLGMSPFHFWMPSIMSKLNWNKCIMLISIMKIPPMLMCSSISSVKTMIPVISLSMIIGSIEGLKQTTLKKILAFSAISNSAWMLMAFMLSKITATVFTSIYTMINVSLIVTTKKLSLIQINQVSMKTKKEKLSMTLNMMSMAGLPPLMGFFPKWIILSEMMTLSKLLSSIMISTSIISMYFYMRISFNSMMTSSQLKKSMIKTKLPPTSLTNVIGMTMIFLIAYS
nr:NADH dehydrogenase subunit 2 [Borysthenes sp. 1 WQW-2023a]